MKTYLALLITDLIVFGTIVWLLYSETATVVISTIAGAVMLLSGVSP